VIEGRQKTRSKAANIDMHDRGKHKQNKIQTHARRRTTQHKQDKARDHYITSIKHQTFFLFTRSEGPMRPSLTKRGCIISHSDWSKGPSCGEGTSRVHLALIFTLLDLPHAAPTSPGFHPRDLRDDVAHERGRRVDELSA
jgi:hypothetical protein